ncbi:MAG: ECF transporter S component [Clostridia bacterium]|nr:ECF transporter S component [Clostridia bacterium]
MSQSINKTRNIAVTAILAATSTALMFLSFPVPLMPGFIKLDFSELPALIASFSMGPLYGVAVCLVKNLVNLLKTQTGGIGELSNFILGAVFVGVAGIIYKRKKTRMSALIGSLAGALAMAGISIVSNYFIIYPIYEKMMPLEAILGMYRAILPSVKTLIQALLIFNAPFTFVKGMLSVIITFLIYKKISPIIKGKKNAEI